ncbi:LytR family transcriptional regulator [Candidatus Microgenomates bacterium]|nr:MAG: LytR family transcriptional regulator [Candidatus Microgenomates bacterium]
MVQKKGSPRRLSRIKKEETEEKRKLFLEKLSESENQEGAKEEKKEETVVETINEQVTILSKTEDEKPQIQSTEIEIKSVQAPLPEEPEKKEEPEIATENKPEDPQVEQTAEESELQKSEEKEAVDEEKSIAENNIMDKTASEEENNPGGRRNIKKMFFNVLTFLIIFLLGMLAGGFIFYTKGINLNKPEQKEVVQAPTATPTPTEVPVDLSKYTIKVLNGSKTKGEAGKLKEELTAGGFNVLSTGNAASSSFTETVIKAKAQVDKAYLKKLKEFLSESYVLASEEELDDTEKTDVNITIGSETP